MALVLAFGIVLLISVSLSGVAARTVLSTSLLFLVAGAVIGNGGLGIVSIGPHDPIVALLAESHCSPCCSRTVSAPMCLR